MSESASLPRSKRQKIDRHGRSAAFEKLRGLKGLKHKAEITEEVDNVYDTIDEREYEKRVLARAEDNWIEDDGTGYVDDGREIFDDDEENDEVQHKTAEKNKSKSKNTSKKRLRDISAPVDQKSSIKSLFGNAVPKKKDVNVKLDEDDILSDILGEIDSKKDSDSSARSNDLTASHRVSRDKKDKDLVKQYMQSFNKAKALNDDDEIINSIEEPAPKRKDMKITPQKNPERLAGAVHHPKAPAFEIDEESPNLPDAPMDDEIDFSILDDNENQFEIKAKIASPAKIVPKTSCIAPSTPTVASTTPIVAPTTPKVKSPAPTVDNFADILSNWDNICKMNDAVDDEMSTTITNEPEANDEAGCKMWFWDAWEDHLKAPGQLFLFGKVAIEGCNPVEYKSVCVKIENVERCMYLLPREYLLDNITKKPTRTKVTFMDIYKEFSEVIAPSLGLEKFRSKQVTKNFAFAVPHVRVPSTCDYLEVRYSGNKPFPNLKTKYNTFAHIFGVNTNSLETLLLGCKIKGPCWLNINNYTVNTCPLSWCKLELICPTITCVSLADDKVTPPPPLVLITLNVRTALNPKTNRNEVVMIACLVNRKFAVDKSPPLPPFQEHCCGYTRPVAQNWPVDTANRLAEFKGTNAIKLESERALLSWFLARFQTIDADLIVIHDAHDCQLDVICDRLAVLKIAMWSRTGRLRMNNIQNRRVNDFFIGRMVCDVKLSAEELIRAKSYDLDSLCTNVLKIKEGERMDVSDDHLYSMYESVDGILKLITLTMQDCSYVLKLMCELNVLPLALQITTICGNLMGRTLQGGRSERNEFLLLHAFSEKNYIVPDKRQKETNWNEPQDALVPAARKKPQYLGGMVLDPVKGFYDKFVLLMDFNSLYPSIIQEYNICFTTIEIPPTYEDGATPVLPPLPDSSVESGVLPRQIRRLVESRREVKKLMADADLEPDQRKQYDIRQIALKLTANSMYGCLGFTFSRFHAQHLAALVTLKGREILMNTKSLVQKLNYDVIYGDTDSIMINTNCIDYDEVYKIGHTIKQKVNKMYRQVELDIDGVFKCLLLLKKKKYASVTITRTKRGEFVYKEEHKGLDIVRRDWSQIAVMAGKFVLTELLSDVPMDERIDKIHAHLERIRDTIVDGSVPVTLLTITKQLTKAPKEYANATKMPHVTVALRMNATRNKRYKKGDMVDYVICSDGTTNPAMQRAYHLDEMRGNETLTIDCNYYLANQVHPVVSRLIEPIDGTDTSRVAVCLGLDPNKFKANAQRVQRERAEDSRGESIVKSTLQKFRNCEKFTFKCAGCQQPNLVASAFRRNENQLVPVLEKCTNNECAAAPYQYVAAVRNQLTLTIRQCIRRFYENWLVCDDPNCNANTRFYSHVTHNNRPVCLSCKQGLLIRQYTESDLFTQLTYFQYMFDLTKHENAQVKLTPEVSTAYGCLNNAIAEVLDNSEFFIVKLSKLFGQLQPHVVTAVVANAADEVEVPT